MDEADLIPGPSPLRRRREVCVLHAYKQFPLLQRGEGGG